MLRLLRNDPALLGVSGSLALDGDGSLGLSVGGQDIDAAGVAHRDRSDESPAGELSRDEVFAGDTGNLGGWFQVFRRGVVKVSSVLLASYFPDET